MGENPMRSRHCKGELPYILPLGDWEGIGCDEPESGDLSILIYTRAYER